MLRFRPVPAIALYLLASLLAACGGGGGGATGGGAAPDASPALTFTPATVSATINAGTSQTLNVTATVVRPADFAGASSVVAVVSDTTGALLPTAQLLKDSDLQYHAVLQTAPTLPLGSHKGNFTIKLCRDSGCASQYPGSPMQLPFDFTVVAAGQATFSATPALPLTATAHVSGAAPPSSSVAIVADGRSWTASAGASWLTLGSASGNGSATLAVGYNASGLAPGSYNTTLTISTNDGQSAALPASLTVLPAGLTFGSDGVNFTMINGTPAVSQSVVIDTDSKTSTAWATASGASWLSTSPTQGSGTPASTLLTVDPSIGALASGDYSTVLAFTAAGLSPRNLPVTLKLVAPTLQTSSNSISLGGTYGRDFSATPTLSFSLNTGANAWPWTLSFLPVWASASPTSGSVGPANGSTVLSAVPASAPLGSSSTMMYVYARVNGDTAIAPLVLNINKDQHRLLPSETAVALSATPGWTRLTRTITVSDNFNTFAGMTATSSQSWLVANVSGNKISLSADPTALGADSLNTATITIVPNDASAVAPEPIRVALWKGTLTPTANVTLPQSYAKVVADPLRPLVYLHNGGALVDIYNIYSGKKVGQLPGFSGTLGDMAISANGDQLYLLDIDAGVIAAIDLNTRLAVSRWPLASAADKSTRLKVIRPNGTQMLVLSNGNAFLTASGKALSLPLQGGSLAASGDGKRLLQQSENNSGVQITSLSVDYAELGGGTLFTAKIPAASHASAGAQGQAIAMSADGSRIYTASSAPTLCSALNPADLGVLYYLPSGTIAPNNIVVASDSRVYCGVASKTSPYDVWVYGDGSTVLLTRLKFSAGGGQLLPRQLAISGDGFIAIGVTDDGGATLVPVGP